MDNFAWIICLLVICMRISDTKCHTVIKRDSLSSGSGPAPQTCGTNNTNFYCPYDKRCKPRSQRCNGNDICIKPNTTKEEGCSETSNPGEYYVFLGHADLFNSDRKKRSIKIKPEHQFVTFRGFTYEFGKSYGVQVLDIADPKYKYKDGKHLKGKGIQKLDPSYCSWEDANKVVEMWKNKEYHLFTNNCQHFADALSEILIRGPCNQPPASRVKRQDNDIEFSQYIDVQLRNCSLVCCYDVSSATVLIHNWFSLVTVMIAINFALFL